VSLIAVALLVAIGVVSAQDEGFKPLFNGKDLSSFRIVPASAEQAFKVQDGMIVVSGKPAGYFATDKGYKNYVLRFDWRYKRPDGLQDEAKFNGNSGLLVHITGEHKVWPRSVEVQGMNREHGRIFAIGGAKGKYTTDTAAQKKAIKPVGEWNTTEVTSENGKLTSKVNGVVISEGMGELTEGPIGWQSEGAEIHFRNIQIKELK
jgi:hypothetical protein